MNTLLEIGIIGLGKFGMQMAKTLVQLGHTVVGIDSSELKVQQAQDSLDTVYKADAGNLSVLRSLQFQHFDCVVVSVGQAMEQSLTITLNLQELGVPKIWVKATNLEHRKILRRLGVDHAIVPEHDAATMAAHHLSNPGMLDLIPKYGGILVQELTVDNWDGKSLVELKLMSDYEVMVIGVRSQDTQEYLFVPPAHTILHKGDVVIVVGRQLSVRKLKP
ncbi:MAG: TrkA family potassium uptake protein [Desulfovibrionaceae bacterium]